MGELKVSAIQTMHHLHVDNIKWETILYNKMRKKPSSTQPDDIQLAKGEKMVSLLQNLTATFLCHKCTCWWESNGQYLSGEDIAENLLSMSAVHRKITFWLDLTHISTSLWLRCRIFRLCLWLDRRSPEKSFECPINQIPYTHQLNFSQNFKVSHPKSI